MPIIDSNKTDDFDRTEVVLSDKDDPTQKAVIKEDRILVDAKLTKDNGQVDTQGRIRTTLPVEIFSYYFAHTPHDLKFNLTNFNSGTGSFSLNLPKGTIDVSNSLDNTHKVNFTTKKYMRYSPGQTHKITIAAAIGQAQTNVEKRWGLFTEFNGFFFKQTSSGFFVCRRTGGAGSPVVETSIAQADFNRDKLDGTGASGLNLNLANHGIYFIEWDWHGAGVIKFGVVYAHELVYCHELEFDFTQLGPSIRSPSMPINVEINNVGTLTTAPTISIAAVSAYKDGADKVVPNYAFSASRGTSAVTVPSNALRPLISIRPKTSFNGLLARVSLVPEELQVLSATNNLFVQVVLNGTLTGANFQSVNQYSNAERDITATAITGGVVVWEGYVSAGTSLLTGEVAGSVVGSMETWELNVSYNLQVPDTLTIVAQSLGNNNTTYASIKWKEYQ